jgi:hypothetical protein
MAWLKEHKLSSSFIRQWIVDREKTKEEDCKQPVDSNEER